MNETLNDQGTGPNPSPGPAAPPPHQDLDRLRRSTSNRYIAGVAGGLGRHFNIDPTIIRVLLVVLAFFGGAGLIVYAVCWLLVPEDNAAHGAIRIGNEPRKILLIAAAGIAFLLAAGDAFGGGFSPGWPIVSIAVVIAVVMIIRDRTRGDGAPPPSPGQATTSSPTTQELVTEGPVSDSSTPTPAGTATPAWTAYESPGDTQVLAGAAQPPTWQPPVARPPVFPPRPKRTGIIWFWPTLALIGIALGGLGIYDDGHHVVDGAYPALALGITAVMLLVGSVVGRPGGLILIGFVSSIALAASVAVGGSFGTDAREIHETPTSAALVHSNYEATVGEIVLDLTRVSDPEALAGREINVELRTGNIKLIVPRSLNVDIDADMDFAGGISVPGDDSGGINHEVHKSLPGVPATTTAPLELNLDAKLGQITVEHR
ncbi:MAG: PspC domain-containing protein [Propionibacteriales bacterium]|nr:PspC domain-containing protein [Propionibacteriales bacterium]